MGGAGANRLLSGPHRRRRRSFADFRPQSWRAVGTENFPARGVARLLPNLGVGNVGARYPTHRAGPDRRRSASSVRPGSRQSPLSPPARLAGSFDLGPGGSRGRRGGCRERRRCGRPNARPRRGRTSHRRAARAARPQRDPWGLSSLPMDKRRTSPGTISRDYIFSHC